MKSSCIVEGCTRAIKARGLCKPHYLEAPRVNGVAKGQKCPADDCGRPVVGRGWCSKHYYRMRRYGTPDGQIAKCLRCGVSWLHLTKGGTPHALCEECRQSFSVCSLCRQVKSGDHFYPDRSGLQTFSSRCRLCSSEYSRTRNMDSSLKMQAERSRLKTRYDITPEKRAQMHEEQDGRCAICLDQPERGLVVDHCHTSKSVRRLLCHQCNTGLGMFKDDPQRLERAVAYLDQMAALERVT